MVEKISGSFYTGVYSVATTFGNIALIIPDAFKELLFSKTSHSEAKQDLSFSFKFSSVVNVLFAIVFYFGGKFAISFLYGSDYSAAYLQTSS